MKMDTRYAVTDFDINEPRTNALFRLVVEAMHGGVTKVGEKMTVLFPNVEAENERTGKLIETGEWTITFEKTG